MSDLPTLKPREVISILTRLGFVCVRQKGSHRQFRHSVDGRQTTVPVHGSRDIRPQMLACIARDIGLNVRDFVRMR
ncbi:hypothetical protein BO91_01535 [Candidatus Synechococcus spongiarum LMB bulk10E]|nr:hypothetical protein BO91_01535 [Candidatus Synechococcus spongiarum LMB bulk10E]